MISFAQPLPIGNAIRVLLEPPAGAVAWRVLRKPSDTFTDQNDATALVAYAGDEIGFVDVRTLTNGTPYYYKPFYEDAAGAWSTAASASATPTAADAALGGDIVELVRARLEAALKVEVDAGRLRHESGYIPCFTAPPEYEGTKFPIVTVHLANQSRAESGIGEVISADDYDPLSDSWPDTEGVLLSVQLQIASWVVGNIDVRGALRQAIAKAILGNFPVFYDQGLTQVEFSQNDQEDFESYSAPMFSTLTNFSCVAPIAVTAPVSPVHTVSVSATSTS